VKRWVNGKDITDRPEPAWLIDFGIDTRLEDAAGYDQPFEYVKQHVLPIRANASNTKMRELWWLFERPRPAMQNALKNLPRFIVTPRVAKHRLFTWVAAGVIPDGRLNVFAYSDDYIFGVLHSQIHETWALANATIHGDGSDGGRPTYNNRVCFETFPFPWPPGQEPTADPRVQAIAQAAKELVEKRDNWLNPPGATAADLKKRTLTNLYNQRPTWLDLAHQKLDQAVLAAYGWPDLLTADGINEDEVLARLLALNLARAQAQPAMQVRLIEDDNTDDE
jgi:type II restriction/modification system DNA methylase subunit YeeA